MVSSRRASFVAVLTGLLAGPALGQGAPARPALPMGAQANGVCADGAPAIYAVKAETAGILAVALSGESPENDLVLVVTDEDGQPLPDGRSDRDHRGNPGQEFLAVILSEPGTYLVHVELSSGGERAKFSVSGGFAPAPALADPSPDPDGRPSRATTITVGKAVEDTLGGADAWDWFKVQAAEAGTLTILTKAPEGDLKLEAFHEGRFRQPIAVSDQDLQGVKGNESLTIDVEAGQTIYIRVSTFFSGEEVVPYRLVTGLIPN
ncbi:MAG: hypothetical protein M9894_24065 [Planctomycetes bacterium]|nr:hypothetical protein [Planctomycetota bacterium]